MRLGITPRRCTANSLGWNPSPPLWATVRHGQCQLRGTVPPTPVRLTCRALERGPAAPSNHFLVNLQGQAKTLGRRNAIPITVDPVRPPPCLQHHAGHCYINPGAVGRTVSVRNVVPTLTSNKRRGLSLNARCQAIKDTKFILVPAGGAVRPAVACSRHYIAQHRGCL
jgi:hypothetical protein